MRYCEEKAHDQISVSDDESDARVDQVFAIWEDIELELLHKLADSVTNRLESVLESGGKPTKY